MAHLLVKSFLVAPLRTLLRSTAKLREYLRRLHAHASLAAGLAVPLPVSTVVLGPPIVYGSGAIHFGEGVLLYPHLHLETQGTAAISIGDRSVLSRGVHLVAMSGITIGSGSMIGEYTSVRDANHQRNAGACLRDAGHTARSIYIGSEVWIGRGVTILGGVTIGDGATVGANAVVTHDVPAGAIVAGIPAAPIRTRATIDPIRE